MTFPLDRLPLREMLEHQLRMLQSPSSRIADAVVLDNRPPWLADPRSPQDDALRGLQQTGRARTQLVNYSALDDPAYLSHFFELRPPFAELVDFIQKIKKEDRQTSGGAALAKSSFSVRNLTRSRGRWYRKEDGEHTASNFLGMLTFLDECVHASQEVGICIFLDADIFLYRSSSTSHSLVDLAGQIFKDNPALIVLEPPGKCDWEHGSNNETCGLATRKDEQVHDALVKVISGRHLIIQRRALEAALPLPISEHDILDRFEEAWSHALRQKERRDKLKLWGRMHCKNETFAIHPSQGFTGGDLDLEQHLAALARQEGFFHRPQRGEQEAAGPAALSPVLINGTRSLIKRLEEGRIRHSLALMECENMMTSEDSIKKGMAWDSHRRHLRGANGTETVDLNRQVQRLRLSPKGQEM